jgi:Tol biopolymer transport system component
VKGAAALAALAAALVLAGAGYVGRSAAAGHGILLLQTEADPRLQQILLWHPGGASPQPLGSSSDWILTPVWSPDGRSIAFAEEQGGWDDPAAYDIWTMNADGSGPKQVTHDATRSNVFRADEPSWSPDGRHIVFVRETVNKPYQELVIVNTRTGRERTLHASGEHPAWGKAGIAYVADYRRIMLVSPASGRPKLLAPVTATGLARVPFKKTNACGVAWSPDGRRLLVRTSRRRVGLWSVSPAGGGQWRRLPLSIGTSNFDNCAVSWR